MDDYEDDDEEYEEDAYETDEADSDLEMPESEEAPETAEEE